MLKWFVFPVLICIAVCCQPIANDSQATRKNHAPEMKGLCWVGGMDSINYRNIVPAVELGANWITQTPFGWMPGIDNPEIVLRADIDYWGESDFGIAHTSDLAKEAGMKILLKPHLWLHRTGDAWRSDLDMQSSADWDLWFENYTNWILHYARFAEEHQIEALCIGTELASTTLAFPEQWESMIAKIRKVYSGKLTYAANWYKEYEHIAFWGDLDFIGIQAYFPLSNKKNPSLKDLNNGWDKYMREMESVSRKFDKPIVFTEVGYRNTADAAKEPWTWPEEMDDTVVLSDAMQTKCFTAFFNTVWNEPWFDGAFIWKWFPGTYYMTDLGSYFEKRDSMHRVWYENDFPIYFTPQRNETQELIRSYYKKEM